MFEYIIRWLWPIEFFLRPWNVKDRIEHNGWNELLYACIGGTLLGVSIGSLIWIMDYGSIHNIWIIAITIVLLSVLGIAISIIGIRVAVNAVAVTIAGIISFLVIYNDIGAKTLTVMIIGAVTAMIVGAGIGLGTFIGKVTNISAAGGTAVISIFYIFIGILGILFGIYLNDEGFSAWLFTLNAIVIIIISLLILRSDKENIIALFLINLLIIFPLFIYFLLPAASNEELATWGISFSVSLSTCILTSIFYSFHNQSGIIKANNSVKSYGLSLFILLGALAIFAWFNLFDLDTSKNNLQTFAIYLAIAPFIFSGILFYPILIFIALHQFKPSRVKHHQQYFSQTLIEKYQSFYLPLPRLENYLVQLTDDNPHLAIQAMHQLQTRSFQGKAAKQAILRILHNHTALNFIGQITQETNPTTLAYFSPENIEHKSPQTIVHTVVMLLAYTGKQEANENQIQIYAIEKPHKNFTQQRKQPLLKRLQQAESYFSNATLQKKTVDGQKVYEQLLAQLTLYVSVKNIHTLYYKINEIPLYTDNKYTWMQPAWEILHQLQHQIKQLKYYMPLVSIDARRRFLDLQHTRLKKLQINKENYGFFWGSIGEELVNYWLNILQKEKDSFKEWVQLEITLEDDQLLSGRNRLNLQIENMSRSIAKDIILHLNPVSDITYSVLAVYYPRLLEGNEIINLSLICEIKKVGDFVIMGNLVGQDLDNKTYEFPVELLVHVR